MAAAATLAGVVLFYALLLPRLGRTVPPPTDSAANQVAEHLRNGKKALEEGSFLLAAGELEAARELSRQHPGLLPPAQGRRLEQLHREAALLSRLLRHSLEEIIGQAAQVRRAEEWEAQFRENYRGRSVIFDDVVRRDSDGGCHLTVYEVRTGGAPARLELGELRLLQTLPLIRPQRLLFGARLASVAREAPNIWVVRFEPDSGVLLTDESAAAAYLPPPLDEEARQLLRRQAALLGLTTEE